MDDQKNIMIDELRVAQLCDFGLSEIAKLTGPASMPTTSPYGETERYRAHELFPSKKNRHPKPSYASDVYALGCVIHQVRASYFIEMGH